MTVIRVQWTCQGEETMQAFLTYDQARERFGLGGTPDSLMYKRIGRVGTQKEIVAAAKEYGTPEQVSRSAPRITSFNYETVSDIPVPAPVPQSRQGLLSFSLSGDWTEIVPGVRVRLKDAPNEEDMDNYEPRGVVILQVEQEG